VKGASRENMCVIFTQVCQFFLVGGQEMRTGQVLGQKATIFAMKGFWKDIPRPIWALAPMEDVTDTVFRRIVMAKGAPDVHFTEFISARGVLNLNSARSQNRLVYRPEEKRIPLVAQIWGTDPETHYKAVLRLIDLGFDGIDINMGCPVKKITRTGGCSALINTPDLAEEIVQAVQGAAGELPVSVKTRIGFHSVVTEDWCRRLLALDLAALTVHGRISDQQSEGEPDWDEIAKVVRLKDQMGKSTLILGNGDVVSHQGFHQRLAQTGVDGIMIGRGIFQDPAIFDRRAGSQPFSQRPTLEKVRMMRDHLNLYQEEWEGKRNYEILKKFYKIYTQGFPEAINLRESLMETHDYAAARGIIEDFLVKGLS
jgi:nifR3 family TIM-barrel protein